MKNRFLAMWAVAVVAAGAAFVAYLALRFETVRLGYTLDEQSQENKRLLELRRMLALEVQTLQEHERVAAIAERSLGMSPPERARIVSVEGAVMARVSAGRAR